MYYVFPAHSASIAIGFDASDQDIVPEPHFEFHGSSYLLVKSAVGDIRAKHARI